MRLDEAVPPCCEPELLIIGKRVNALIERMDSVSNRLSNKATYLFGEAELMQPPGSGQLKGKAPGVIGDLKDALDTLEQLTANVQGLLSRVEQA